MSQIFSEDSSCQEVCLSVMHRRREFFLLIFIVVKKRSTVILRLCMLILETVRYDLESATIL